MEFITTEHENCHVIAVSGRIDSYTSPNLENELDTLLTEGHSNIIIDLSNVSYLSSSGMLVLINAEKKSHIQDRGKLILVCVPDRVLSSLELAGFDQIFDIFPDVNTALGQF